MTSTTGIANPKFSFDPVTGKLTILDDALTGPKSYGTCKRTNNVFATGDCSGTLFSCNTFDQFVVGLNFSNATISNQGSGTEGVDNTWFEQTGQNGLSEARIKANNLTSQIDYFHTTGIHKNPSSGFGIQSNGFPVISVLASNTIADCGALNKTTSSSLFTTSSDLKLYPNPSTGFITIDIGLINSATIEVFNSKGEIVYTGIALNQINQYDLALPKGLYLVKVESKTTSATEKLIIH